jgi:hypothetical protein
MVDDADECVEGDRGEEGSVGARRERLERRS